MKFNKHFKVMQINFFLDSIKLKVCTDIVIKLIILN